VRGRQALAVIPYAGFLGVRLDDAHNEEASGDVAIGAQGAAVATLVVRAREDLEIARQVRAVLAG